MLKRAKRFYGFSSNMHVNILQTKVFGCCCSLNASLEALTLKLNRENKKTFVQKNISAFMTCRYLLLLLFNPF